MRQEQESDRVYRTTVTMNVVNAVIDAGRVEGAEGGIVDLHGALKGMSDAIALLVANAGADRTPADRKRTADYCRRRILETSQRIAEAEAAGVPITWGAREVRRH